MMPGPALQKKGPSAKTKRKRVERAAMMARDWALKISPVTPPPWRQRIRGRESVGSGGIEVISADVMEKMR